MAIYAIGDIQGCLTPLEQLLEQLKFDPSTDQIWLTGDLVNRGPYSLKTLRLVKSLGKSAITVLGNHDLHLLAVAHGIRSVRNNDSIEKILNANDSDELLHWLRHLPFIHADDSIRTLMTHAGVYPMWSRAQLVQYANEVETILRGDEYCDLLHHMYGKKPSLWHHNLVGKQRICFIINALTRMRFCDLEGSLNFKYTCKPGSQSQQLIPWYQHPQRQCRQWRIVFGHWSALGYHRFENVIALDSGCVWGRALTAVRLDQNNSSAYWQVQCGQNQD